MTSLATFKSTYLAPPPNQVLPAGARQQMAGPISAIDQQVANGASVANALTYTLNKRSYRIVHNAQRQSSPFQGTLVADYLALSAA
jgi:hypothetical protein